MKKSLLILLEGISGSGKGSYLKFIDTYFKQQGYNVHTLTEPSQFLNNYIRVYHNNPNKDPYVELFLFMADRRHLFINSLAPLLAKTDNVILSDRSFISTMVYQSLQGIPLDLIISLNDFYPKPDLALIFLCEPKEALRRIRERKEKEGKEQTPDENLRRIIELKKRYEEVSRLLPYAKLINTDGEIEDIKELIKPILRGLIKDE